MDKPVVIGTRGSDLALWQANFVKAQLEAAFPDLTFRLKTIATTGDRVVDVALSKIGDKGLFTRQIENELLEETIDLAVHSLKDLQTQQPAGLRLGAVCKRERPHDALILRGGFRSLSELPQGARVATGSLRRRSQLLAHRPDLKVEEMRGNVPTRLRKFDESGLDGMVLAYAGLHRLGFEDRVAELIPFDVMLPAVGQGAVAVEIRSDDPRIAAVMEQLDHPETRLCVTAERALLRRLEGGCQVPIAGLATIANGSLTLTGLVGTLDGSVVLREAASGRPEDAESVGEQLAERLLAQGAERLLDDSRAEANERSQKVL